MSRRRTDPTASWLLHDTVDTGGAPSVAGCLASVRKRGAHRWAACAGDLLTRQIAPAVGDPKLNLRVEIAPASIDMAGPNGGVDGSIRVLGARAVCLPGYRVDLCVSSATAGARLHRDLRTANGGGGSDPGVRALIARFMIEHAPASHPWRIRVVVEHAGERSPLGSALGTFALDRLVLLDPRRSVTVSPVEINPNEYWSDSLRIETKRSNMQKQQLDDLTSIPHPTGPDRPLLDRIAATYERVLGEPPPDELVEALREEVGAGPYVPGQLLTADDLNRMHEELTSLKAGMAQLSEAVGQQGACTGPRADTVLRSPAHPRA